MKENRLFANPDSCTGRPEISFRGSKGRFTIASILSFIVALSTASEGIAQNPPYQMIHEGKHWTWYARQDQARKYKTQIAPYYDYADKVFDKLCGSWGLKPPRDKYALLVNAQTGGGFAAGDISEIRPLTGKPTPGIGCAYDAFLNVANGIKGYWALSSSRMK